MTNRSEKRLPKTHLVLDLDDGQQVRYVDQKQMGQLYLTRGLDAVPEFSAMGPEPFEITLEQFRARLRPFRGEIKGILTHGEFVAGIGNAYADEILWAARLHPYRKGTQLTADEVDRLYEAMRATLSEAVEKVRQEMQKEAALAEREAKIASQSIELQTQTEEISRIQSMLGEETAKLDRRETSLKAREQDTDKSMAEYEAIVDGLAKKKDELELTENELRSKTESLERSVREIEVMQSEIDKDKALLREKDEGLEQLRHELEKWRDELEEKKEKIEEEIKERVEAISRDAMGVARAKETLTANEQALLSREVEIRALEGQLKGREHDLETRERTITVEMTRLEKERAEVQDLWEKVSVSKKDLAAVIDEKMVGELERRKQELDDMYLKLADREDSIHKDEHRLEGEWSRLHSIEEELSELARILKSREDELKRLEG